VIRGWLTDFFGSLGAPWVWNARKAVFALRGRRGACPCHNPSDSGRPGETRCEAVLYWHEPARFARRVCPLLRATPDGSWRCSVPAAGVRTFWLRPLGTWAATLGVLALVAGAGLWGTMRAVGFPITPRQVFWPPAWSELGTVRAGFFRTQAERRLEAGLVREALAALRVANDLEPGNYRSGLLAAQLQQLVRAERADAEFRRLYDLHPDHREDTARIWLGSMLARAQLRGVAQLARRRLAETTVDGPVWLHALLVALRLEQRWDVLANAAEDPALPEPVRRLLALELRLRREDAATLCRTLAALPPPTDAYAALHRVERLLEFGDSLEALQALQESASVLAPRDHVRLALAAHPDSGLLEQARAALLTRPPLPATDQGHAAAAVYAAHACGNRADADRYARACRAHARAAIDAALGRGR